tara:strand:+ start:2085 stop:2786 length:702 start_codon:yes stop_codon:yes gene_type:complete
MIKTEKLMAGLFCLMAISSLHGEGIADMYWYEARPGKVAEVTSLMREGRDIAIANGQSTIVHKQNIGEGAENRFLWVDFFESYSQKAKQAYSDVGGDYSKAWARYIDKMESSDALTPLKSYSMTSMDAINPGNYIVQVYTWEPKPGEFAKTLLAMEEAQKIFESHGYLIDIWQHGLGSGNYLQFTMLSTSRESQAKSFEALLADDNWASKQQEWFDEKKYGRLVESYEMTVLD